MSSKLLICELFGLPKEETIFEDFGCALQQTILLHGRLFVSEHHVCFYANIMGLKTKQVISFNEIQHLEKKAVFGFIPNAIEIKTFSKTFYFCSFSKRNSAFQLLFSLWKEVPFSQENEPIEDDFNEGVEGVDPSQGDILLNEMASTEINFLQTDSKDNQKELLKVILPVSVEGFFDLLFSDDAKFSLLEHYKLKGEREITLSKWIENPEMGSFTRELKMVINVKENPLKDHSRCYKVQSYKKEGGKLTINSNTKNLDIPYGSCFQVEETWELTQVEDSESKCMLRCLVWVVFNKSTLFKGFIEGKVMEGVRKDYESYISNIKEQKVFEGNKTANIGNNKIRKKKNEEWEFEKSKAMDLPAEDQKEKIKEKNKKNLEKAQNQKKEHNSPLQTQINGLRNFVKINICLNIFLILIILGGGWYLAGVNGERENAKGCNFVHKFE